VKERAGKDLPDEAIGFALNPVFARSQDQLHVHMDCVKEDVMKLLADHQGEMSSTWGSSTINFEGFDFRSLFRQADDLKSINPVQLLKKDLGDHANLIGQHTLIVIGGRSADGKNGFYILDGTSDPAGAKKIHGEDWLDKDCALAKK
jgi:CDP-diacylglycerol pyrophosphatase